MKCDTCEKDMEIENILLSSKTEIEITYCHNCKKAYVSSYEYEIEVDN